MANSLLQGVVDGQTYSQYSGSAIYAVDKATGERTSTLPDFPFVTVGTNKTDKGISNSQGLYIPKYVN